MSDSVNLTWFTITTAQRMAYKATTVLPRIPTRHVFLSQVGGANVREWAGQNSHLHIQQL